MSKSRIQLGGFIWLWTYLSPHRKVFLPSLVALFVTAGLSLCFPWFLNHIIGNPADALKTGVDAAVVMQRVDRDVLMMLGVLALQASVGYWRVQGFTRSAEAAMNDMRQDIFATMLKLPMSFFHEQRSGTLSNRLSSDLTIVRDTLLNTVPQAARQVVILVGGLIAVFVASWKLSLLMLTCVPLVAISVALIGKRVRQHSRGAQDALEGASAVVEEACLSIADVKAFVNEDFENLRYRRELEEFYHVACRGAKARGAFLSFIIFVMFGTIAVVTWFGARLFAAGEISNWQFVSFITFSVFVGASLGSIPEIMSQLQSMNGATERLRELFSMPPERAGGAEYSALKGDITFQDVEFAYPSRGDQAVLRRLSFHVHAGQRVALVGSSGGGKSTVLSLLMGFYAPQAGKIMYDGLDVNQMDLASLRRQVALVPQEILLFGGTIAENIAYGVPGATREAIVEAAKIANAHQFIELMPEGYQTLVGPRGIKLSGGQRQRVAIARAVLMNPRLLLLDEATSSLDTESEQLVNEALERLMLSRTAIVVAHRLSTVVNADLILVIKDGQVVESGKHDELLALNGFYRLLAQTQTLV